MSSDAANFIGDIPGHYDRALGPMIFVDYATDIARRAADSSPARVLETAAGTGIVTRQLRSFLNAGAHLTATDLNPPMLEVARTKFRPGEQVEFRPADAAALPFPDGTFEAVVCQFGVMFFPDKDRSYHEVYRVLVPGGRYLFSVWDSHRYNAFGRLAHEVAGSFFPDDPPQFYRVPFSYYRIDPIKESLLGAGFADITVTIVTLEKAIPSAAFFARGLIHGNPLIEQIMSRGGVDPGRIHAQALRRVRRDGVDGLGPRFAQVDLGRLVQDEVVVQPERPGDLDGQGDAHGGHRDHHLGPVGGQALGQLPPGLLGEGHPVVHADE